METWIRLEIAFRIHWRRSRTPETRCLGRKRVEIRILGVGGMGEAFFNLREFVNYRNPDLWRVGK